MRTGIGILLNPGDAAIFFDADEGGELSFEVRYSDGGYEILPDTQNTLDKQFYMS